MSEIESSLLAPSTPAEEVALAGFLERTDEYPELDEAAGKIMDNTPAQAFKVIDTFLNELFLNRLQAQLGTVPSAIASIFTNGDWKGILEDSPLKEPLLKIYAQMHRLRGQLVTRYVNESAVAENSLNATARMEYRHFADIANATNEFFIRWHADAGKVMDSDERLRRGLKDELATIRTGDEGSKEVKWNVAFADDTSKLSALYATLASDIEGLSETRDSDEESTLVKTKATYYRAVAKAWQTCDIKDWYEADTLLPGQTNGRNLPVHIHTIETGYGTDRIQRLPEASLRAPDEEFQNINDIALQTRTRMAKILRELFAEGEYTDAMMDSLSLMERSVFAARHFMGAGHEMDSNPAGQILPNEDECRAKGGLDISVDPVAMKRKLPLIAAAFEAVFGEKLPETEADIPEMTGRRIASHEYSHAVGITPDLTKRIPTALSGPFGEEWKATVGGMIADEYLPFLKRENTMEDLRTSLTHHAAMLPRYTSMRSNPGAIPYLRKSIMLAKLMGDTGCITGYDAHGYELDLSDGKILGFYGELFNQYKAYLHVYDTGTSTDMVNFLDQHLQPNDYVRWQADRIDAHFGNAGLMSMNEVCIVPR